MLLTPPIFDRTIADVDHAKATREYYEQLKGAQGFVAWNRLTGNMHRMAIMLTGYGYNITLTCKTNWLRGSKPTVGEVTLIRSDLALLRQTLKSLMNYSWSEWTLAALSWQEINNRNRDTEGYFSRIPLPFLPWTHFEKINDVEEITFILDQIIESIKHLFRISGTFASGQVSYLPHFVEVPESDDLTWLDWNLLQKSWQEINDRHRTKENFFKR